MQCSEPCVTLALWCSVDPTSEGWGAERTDLIASHGSRILHSAVDHHWDACAATAAAVRERCVAESLAERE